MVFHICPVSNAYISGLSQHGNYPVPLLPGEIPDRISIGRILLYCCIPVYLLHLQGS